MKHHSWGSESVLQGRVFENKWYNIPVAYFSESSPPLNNQTTNQTSKQPNNQPIKQLTNQTNQPTKQQIN